MADIGEDLPTALEYQRSSSKVFALTNRNDATPGANAKKAGFGPLFRIRSCRIAGWSCCQFIRGQRRTGIVEGHDFIYRALLDRRPPLKPSMPILLRGDIASQNDRRMTSTRHFCERIGGKSGISASHGLKIR
ncbi:hypothetical protein [Rhizobium sp. AN80A]|uniref:hypothetical protein n=1 Tax=Rhizobium sp. AN80A TaxID=3040673 RepID=UPI0024B39054|nr:hypothetical protein [Rhizobium sp. AN80A]